MRSCEINFLLQLSKDEPYGPLKGVENVYIGPEGVQETTILCNLANDMNTPLNISYGARPV